jgi:hypothetical protein
MKYPRPNLKYVDAGDLEDNGIKFKGMEVDSFKGEKLGQVEGFIIDILTGRPYHIVVGAGHWFKHKHVLLPVGHAMLAASGDKLIADITKERVERFPGFDKDLFDKLSEEDLKALSERLSAACTPDEVVAIDVSVWDTVHYTYPTWWEADFYRPDRADQAAMDIAGATHLSGAGIPPRDEIRGPESGRAREQMTAREDTGGTGALAEGGAHPGDVIGVETGGERTYVGDTSEDENKRRRDAEEAARKR